jgi:5-deoxy-glucuronate isomerase
MENELNQPQNWKYISPETEGFHEVINPENSACKITWIFRLNLLAGKSHILKKEDLELNAVIISGEAEVLKDIGNFTLGSRD